MDSLIDPVYQAQNLMRASAPRDRFIQKKKPLHRPFMAPPRKLAGAIWHSTQPHELLFMPQGQIMSHQPPPRL
jgi:hypothetical protein